MFLNCTTHHIQNLVNHHQEKWLLKNDKEYMSKKIVLCKYENWDKARWNPNHIKVAQAWVYRGQHTDVCTGA